MTDRTIDTTVTFTRPFKLWPMDAPQAPGTYRVVVDEEEILGLSFVAYRRTATMLHTPAIGASVTSGQVYSVQPADLSAALDADARP
jgi:hypothetical protein